MDAEVSSNSDDSDSMTREVSNEALASPDRFPSTRFLCAPVPQCRGPTYIDSDQPDGNPINPASGRPDCSMRSRGNAHLLHAPLRALPSIQE